MQDAVGVWAFRRSWDGYVLGWMMPGAGVGVVLGWLFAARVSPGAVLGLVGGISVVFGSYRLWSGRYGAVRAASRSPGWVGTIAGIASGFTSQVAHAGQPPFQMWVLPRKLSRDSLVGTTAIFFAATNWLKVPAYWALGQFSTANMLASVALLPVAVASTFAGVWFVKRVPAGKFYTAIYVLMILVGCELVWEAI